MPLVTQRCCVPFFDYPHVFTSQEAELLALIQDAGRRVYDELIDVASGKVTTGEILRLDDAFVINRIGPSV